MGVIIGFRIRYKMQLHGHHIEAPAENPPTWEGIVVDCVQRVTEVRKALYKQVKIDDEAGKAVDQVLASAMLSYIWRDVRVDVMEHGLMFIPGDIADKHGLDLAMMRKALSLDTDRGCEGDAQDGSCHCANMPNSAMNIVLPAYRETMHDLVKRTQALLLDGGQGSKGLAVVERRELRRLALESTATLRMIARRDYDTLTRRPMLGTLSRGLIELRMRLRI